jgi:hypothetical protein
MRRILFFAVAAALLASTAAYAHHSYASTYDVTKQVSLKGKVVQFVFRNPHSFVHVQATDDSGAQQRWAVEWSGVSQLGGQGLNRESLKVGDEVVIVGRPSRVAGEYRALMVSLKRPSDGFTWGTKGEAVD